MIPKEERTNGVNDEQILFECPSCKTLIELNDEHKKPLDMMLKIYICYHCKGIYYIKGLDSSYRIRNKLRYKTWKLTDFQKLGPDYYDNGLLKGEIIKDWITIFGGGFSRFKWWTRY
jgi:hypothetical protein